MTDGSQTHENIKIKGGTVMKTLKLTEKDIDKLLKRLIDADLEDTLKYASAELDNGIYVGMLAELIIDGYSEDDYFRGTGAFIVTDAIAKVKIVSCSDEVEDYKIENQDDVEQELRESLENYYKN